MPNLTITGTIHDAVPRPDNHAGSITRTGTVGQATNTDVVAAVQGDLSLTQEVQSFVAHVALSMTPAADYWTALFAVRDVVKRMIESCGDVTSEHTFTM